jgi:hypothetical protein
MPSSCFNYLDCDVPAGMTLEEYRRRRARLARPGLLTRLRSRASRVRVRRAAVRHR